MRVRGIELDEVVDVPELREIYERICDSFAIMFEYDNGRPALLVNVFLDDFSVSFYPFGSISDTEGSYIIRKLKFFLGACFPNIELYAWIKDNDNRTQRLAKFLGFEELVRDNPYIVFVKERLLNG